MATDRQASASSAPNTVLPYPAAASTTTTFDSRHSEVSRGRRMWCGGSTPTWHPSSALASAVPRSPACQESRNENTQEGTGHVTFV